MCSDAVPDFIGEKYVDHVEACTLNMEVVTFCRTVLKPGGVALIKIIQGPETEDLLDGLSYKFNSVTKIKPNASW